MKVVLTLVLIASLHMSALGQCGGNGGFGDLLSTPLIPGTTVTLQVVGAGGAPFILYMSASIAPVVLPVYGPLCINLGDPILFLLAQGLLPGSGTFALPIGIPNDPGLLDAFPHHTPRNHERQYPDSTRHRREF
jgi:hypothetical protein